MSVFWSNSHTILITGGGSGIGLAFAKRWVLNGHKVIITGRRLDQLQKAQAECPSLITIVGDVSSEEGRHEIVEKILNDYPDVNVLVNNAGIQNRLPPLTSLIPSHGIDLWQQHKKELNTNIDGPIHLSMLFIPHLIKREQAMIINVTSGLAFVPMSAMSMYCTTKAALHSFTISLRHQLQSSSIRVVEIVPPAVDTDLGGVGLHKFGENLDEFADHIFVKLLESDDNVEIGFKMSESLRNASAEQRAVIFSRLNSVTH